MGGVLDAGDEPADCPEREDGEGDIEEASHGAGGGVFCADGAGGIDGQSDSQDDDSHTADEARE